jgi:ABC-type glycerol-3-phosphate transport system substrate-binding protein
MKFTYWLIAVISLLGVSVVSAQSEDIILQLTIPFFAEDLIQESVNEFEAQNPGIQVQLLPYQGFGIPVQNNDDPEEYQNNLAAYFQSADVLFVNNGLSSKMTRAGYLLDLTPLTSSDPNYSDENFYSALVNSFRWDMGQWALPISTSFVVMVYDPAAFDAVGLAYPTDTWTIADLEFAARTLTQVDADGSTTMPGLFVQGNNNRNMLFTSLSGQSLDSEATFPGEPDFSNPQLEDILDTWMTMEADGLMTLPEDVDNEDVPLRIANPQQGGGGFFNNNDEEEPELATALLPGGTAGLSVNGYAISSGSRYPEAAYTLLTFLLSDSNAISVSGGTVPALRNVEVSTDDGFPPAEYGAGKWLACR